MTSKPSAVLALLMLACTCAAAADRPDAVVVTNGANAAIPVLVTNPQSAAPPAPKTTFTDLSAGTSATVMPAPGAGKRFVVRHLDAYMASNISGVGMIDTNCVLSLHQGSTSFAIAIYPLRRTDLYGAMALSQSEYLVLGPADSLEMTCVSNPANTSGRATISGDVLTGP